MEHVFNFKLNEKTLSKTCKALGLNNFIAVCNYVHQLPYGRNKNRGDYSLILIEQKGTCSTKHAFLKQIALENNVHEIKLALGIYKMKEFNTKGVGAILKKHSIDYIPKAHVYLKYNDTIYDFTRPKKSNISFEKDLMYQEFIMPDSIRESKVKLHKLFIKDWIKTENISYSFQDI